MLHRHARTARRSALTALGALVLAGLPAAASAQEDDTVTISGTFNMDYSYGELDLYYFDPDLLTVAAARSSRVPMLGGYLVYPFRIASLPASAAVSGVP